MIRTWFTIAAVVWSLSTSLPAPAAEGASGGTRGGGERYAAHFATVAERLDGVYRRLCAIRSPDTALVCGSQDAFSKAVAQAKVFPYESLVGADGQPREAGPDGKGNVMLNVGLYQARIEKAGSGEGTASIVAHEYMIAAGQESVDQYTTSSVLVSALKANYVDFDTLVPVAPKPEDGGNQQVLENLYCSKDRFNTPHGVKCQHPQTGYWFERLARPRLGLAWRDPFGVIWQQINASNKLTASSAAKMCKSIGARLPTQDEADRALGAGIQHFLLDSDPSVGDWTSTPVRVRLPKYDCGFLGWGSCELPLANSFWVMVQDKTDAPAWYRNGMIIEVTQGGKITTPEPVEIIPHNVRCVR